MGCRALFAAKTNMNCFYLSNNSHFLWLAPLKVEQLSLEPYLALFHDVIYATEMNEMTYIYYLNSHAQLSSSQKSIKVQKNASDMLNYRIKDMTGLSIEQDTAFELISHKVAEHNLRHSDSQPAAEQAPKLGDRLATIMFFLNEVPQGGATMFPALELTVQAKKGAALVWHNLNNKLKTDNRVDHLFCSVLVGYKLTLLKYLHEQPQMLKRPCLRV
ncbi:prolyl 4-hydroxylase subunit alpha-3-like [Drosophila busckii]|uniref:prolyl 4-hydroxylase subunit alpha-3-like n=1 Tax=Drosophila busckii TaxID=30019 RepID=UPI001432CFF1|nr:prolyl 4-hydroxylase subunit alpha-3-like [Drosophila busckii]